MKMKMKMKTKAGQSREKQKRRIKNLKNWLSTFIFYEVSGERVYRIQKYIVTYGMVLK